MRIKKDHVIHKYYQTAFKSSGTVIYRCGLEGCPHFLYEPLILGRISICWRCRDAFTITQRTLRAKKLHCEDCTRGKHNKPRQKTAKIKMTEESGEIIDQILTDINSTIPTSEPSEKIEESEEEKKGSYQI